MFFGILSEIGQTEKRIARLCRARATGLRPLCRKKQTIRQSKWPALYGARTENWYRQRHLVTTPTGFGRVKVVSTLETGRPKRDVLTTQGPESRSAQVQRRAGKQPFTENVPPKERFFAAGMTCARYRAAQTAFGASHPPPLVPQMHPPRIGQSSCDEGRRVDAWADTAHESWSNKPPKSTDLCTGRSASNHVAGRINRFRLIRVETFGSLITQVWSVYHGWTDQPAPAQLDINLNSTDLSKNMKIPSI
jgi:hypothetical protein